MLTELDVTRTAQRLVRNYGADAPIRAAMRHDALLDQGDPVGAGLWKRLLAAIDGLLDARAPDRLALH